MQAVEKKRSSALRSTEKARGIFWSGGERHRALRHVGVHCGGLEIVGGIRFGHTFRPQPMVFSEGGTISKFVIENGKLNDSPMFSLLSVLRVLMTV